MTIDGATAPANGDAVVDAVEMAAEAVAFCAATPQLAAALGEGIEAVPLAGGFINEVYMAQGSKGKLLIKRGGAVAKGCSDIVVDQARVATEALVMRLAHSAAPDAVPQVVMYCPDSYTLATEFLDGRESLTVALCRGAVHPGLAATVGSALARIGAASTRASLGEEAHAELAETLAESASVAGIVEEFALILPFDPDEPSNRVPPGLEREVGVLVYHHPDFSAELRALRRLLAGVPPSQAVVVHQDTWSGNLLCAVADDHSGGGAAHIIDFETAMLGHSCYDLGHLLATFLHCALAARGLAEAGDRPEARPAQEEWMEANMPQAWEAYWAERRVRGPPVGLPAGAEEEQALLADALGYAGLVLLRWTIGSFNIFEVMGVAPGTAAHTASVRRAVHLGSALVRHRRRIPSIHAAAGMLRAVLDGTAVEAAAQLLPEEEETPLPAAAKPTRAEMLGRSRSCLLSTKNLGTLSRVLMRQHTSARELLVPHAE